MWQENIRKTKKLFDVQKNNHSTFMNTFENHSKISVLDLHSVLPTVLFSVGVSTRVEVYSIFWIDPVYLFCRVIRRIFEGCFWNLVEDPSKTSSEIETAVEIRRKLFRFIRRSIPRNMDCFTQHFMTICSNLPTGVTKSCECNVNLPHKIFTETWLMGDVQATSSLDKTFFLVGGLSDELFEFL